METIYKYQGEHPSKLDVCVVKEFAKGNTKFYVSVNRSSCVVTRKVDFTNPEAGIIFKYDYIVTNKVESVLIEKIIKLIKYKDPHSFGCLDDINILINNIFGYLEVGLGEYRETHNHHRDNPFFIPSSRAECTPYLLPPLTNPQERLS